MGISIRVKPILFLKTACRRLPRGIDNRVRPRSGFLTTHGVCVPAVFGYNRVRQINKLDRKLSPTRCTHINFSTGALYLAVTGVDFLHISRFPLQLVPATSSANQKTHIDQEANSAGTVLASRLANRQLSGGEITMSEGEIVASVAGCSEKARVCGEPIQT